jgi:hypothetical protein
MAEITEDVVAEDARLEKRAEGSRLALAKHRWHWTKDPDNPDRVAVRAYSRAIGRNERTIRDIVSGYEEWVRAGAPRSEFGDYQARAKMSGDTATATEAVAKAKNISVESARRHHAEEVREVKATAQERAVRNKTTVEAEVPRVADDRVKLAVSNAKRTAEKKAAHTTRYIVAEGKIAVAMRNLRSVLDEDAIGVEFTEEERELLMAALGQLRAVLNLLDVQLVGSTDVDWDAEMAKLTGGAA